MLSKREKRMEKEAKQELWLGGGAGSLARGIGFDFQIVGMQVNDNDFL